MAERGDPRDPTYRGTVYEQELRSRYERCSSYVRNQRVLDAPCGTGWGASTLRETASITAIDIDLDAALFGASQHPSIRFAAGTIASLPFQDGAFDVALCLEGLEHVYRSDAKAAIAEIWRTLASGGLLIATVPLLKHGQHSGNPFHLFEYSESSILSLLSAWFETEEQEVFWAAGGPDLWFVGRRRPAPLEEPVNDDRANAVIARAKRWLDSVRVDEGFSYAPGQPKTVNATCMAVLLLEGMGALAALGEAERSACASYIQSSQDPDAGLFHDPSAGPAADAQEAEYLDWHTTYLAIQALDALGASVPAPLRFTGRFDQPGAVEVWLDGLEWRDAGAQGRRIMSLLAAVIQRVEREQETGQAALYHRILDWLDREQHPRTGFWGIAQGAPPAAALACAYQVLPFYEYVRRPVPAIHRIIESTLELQQEDGLFGAPSEGEAFQDLAAVDVLTLALRHAKYRSGDVKRGLIRAYWAAWNLQHDDGGFGSARSDAGTGSGDVRSTWARLLTLATVAAQFPADAPACGWQFRRWPALGYHRYGTELSEEERAVLPAWIQRADAPRMDGQAAVTVVVTCYNLGIYLHEAITSVFRQTLEPLRIILVDDGSTDPFTGFLLDLMPWSGVEVIRKRNEGVSIARNTAIEKASTPYICCLDGDDRLQPEYLAKAVELLNTDPQIGFVSCHYRLFDCEEGTYRYNDCGLPNELVRNEAVGVSVFRKDAWRAAGGYSSELSGMEDWDLWIGILESGYRDAVIPEVLFDYRIRPESKYSVTRRPENFQRLVGIIARRHAALYERYAADIIPLQARYFSELVQFHREQVGTRDRAAARLSRNLARERRIAEERRAWIERLEEAKQWFVGQLQAAEEQKRACQTCAASTEQELANRIAELSAQVEQLNELRRRFRDREEKDEEEASAAHLKIAELTRQVEKLQTEVVARREPELTGRHSGAGLPSIDGMLRGAAMACSMAMGNRRRNLLLWAKALANAESRRLLREHYNSDYYLRRNPDVARSGIPGLLHYICAGDIENRNPSETFDSRFYRKRYADVARSGVHPFLHYVLFGAREGRAGSRRELHGAGFAPGDRVWVNNEWPAGTPLVSVVIPCFNYGAYIEDAIGSVSKQTFSNYEIIVVEGGSTDGVTPELLRELQSRYPAVRFFFRTGRHLAGDNRNYGIGQARGRYICCLDADDLIRPTYLEAAVFLAERYGYDVVYPSAQCFGDSTITWALTDATFPEIAGENQISTVALFRKAAWEAVGGFRDWGTGREHVPEDWDFWLRVLGRGFRAKSIREPLMLYRVHGGSLSGTDSAGIESQRRAIAEANRDLLEAPVQPLRETAVANTWANLGPLPSAGGKSLLIALPYLAVGGAETLFFTLVQGLLKRGYRVVIVTTLPLPEKVTGNSGLFDPLTPSVYHLPELFPEPRLQREFLRYLIRRYDVRTILMAGCESVYRLLPEIDRDFPEVRVVDQLFNDTGHMADNREYAGLIDVHVVPSQALGKVLIEEYGEDPGKVKVIPHGVNAAVPAYRNRDEAFAASGLPAECAGKFLVSFFGRLSEEKSPRTFVEIARRLSSHPDIHFCLTGEGPERAAVMALIERYNLAGRIFAPGFVPDVRPLIACSDVVILPSRVDGMPLIVLESQMFGKPVVASSVGSLPEMIQDGITGYLCPVNDVDAFCASVERLRASPELRREIGERARAAAIERHDARRMIDSYIAAFDLPAGGALRDAHAC